MVKMYVVIGSVVWEAARRGRSGSKDVKEKICVVSFWR